MSRTLKIIVWVIVVVVIIALGVSLVRNNDDTPPNSAEVSFN